MLKILYISPENTVGVLSYWKRAHELNGNLCRYVTFFRSAGSFPEDICLDLPLIAAKPWFMKPRRLLSNLNKKRKQIDMRDDNPPVWNPPDWQKRLFRLREMLWEPIVNKAIYDYHLDEFDVYHFEWGTDFYRDARFARLYERIGNWELIKKFYIKALKTAPTDIKNVMYRLLILLGFKYSRLCLRLFRKLRGIPLA